MKRSSSSIILLLEMGNIMYKCRIFFVPLFTVKKNNKTTQKQTNQKNPQHLKPSCCLTQAPCKGMIQMYTYEDEDEQSSAGPCQLQNSSFSCLCGKSFYFWLYFRIMLVKPVKSHTSCNISFNFISAWKYSSAKDLIRRTALCFFSTLESQMDKSAVSPQLLVPCARPRSWRKAMALHRTQGASSLSVALNSSSQVPLCK